MEVVFIQKVSANIWFFFNYYFVTSTMTDCRAELKKMKSRTI